MSPPLIALDLAILVPEPLLHPCTTLNASLSQPPKGFRFDDTHLPHVTLVQQFVRNAALSELVEQVGATLGDTPPVPLRTATLGSGGTTSILCLERTAPLDRLHRTLMDRLAPFDTPGGSRDAFVSDTERPRSSDVRWVQQFRAEAAYDRFDPHITLGVGPVADWTGPTRALAEEIALFQLGRFCTCRRALARWTLTPRDP